MELMNLALGSRLGDGQFVHLKCRDSACGCKWHEVRNAHVVGTVQAQTMIRQYLIFPHSHEYRKHGSAL